MNARMIPYGYKMEKGIIGINEEEANQVRRIFNMRLSGTGVYAIGKMLYEQQIPFFNDTRDKAIKKASAILYKPIYAGKKGYPAIIDREIFDKVLKMKTQAFRKPKIEEKADVTKEKYEFIVSEETEKMKTELEQMIESHTIDGTAVREMIFTLAAKNYSCIYRKGDA